MPSAYAYNRVSTDMQTAGGMSLGMQLANAKRFFERIRATKEGIRWGTECFPDGDPGIFVDAGVSAWKKRFIVRPAGGKLDDILKPGDHVIFNRLDRGFRSVADFSRTTNRWIKQGIAIHFCKQRFSLESANGKLMSHFIAAVAQWESDVKSERMLESFAARKAQKESSGKPKEIWEPSPEMARYRKTIALPKRATNLAGRVWVYIRVSHRDSVESGASLAAQEHMGREYARWLCEECPELEIAGVAAELAVSAYKVPLRSRQRGKELDAVLQPGDHVIFIFSRLDRAFRNVADMSNTLCDSTDGQPNWLDQSDQYQKITT